MFLPTCLKRQWQTPLAWCSSMRQRAKKRLTCRGCQVPGTWRPLNIAQSGDGLHSSSQQQHRTNPNQKTDHPSSSGPHLKRENIGKKGKTMKAWIEVWTKERFLQKGHFGNVIWPVLLLNILRGEKMNNCKRIFQHCILSIVPSIVKQSHMFWFHHMF